MSRAHAPRAVGWLALAGVSLIAGIASWFHALAVVEAAGARAPVAYLVPFLADLVILGASADLLAASRAGQARPRLTMVALGAGVVVTLTFNLFAGHPHAMPSWLVDGWPALAFILALESLSGLVRRGRGGTSATPVPATPNQVPADVQSAALAALKATTAAGNPLSGRQLETRFGLSRAEATRVRELAGPADAAGAPEPLSTGASRPPQSAMNGNGGAS